MLYTSYVLIDRHPMINFIFIKGDNLWLGEQNLKKYQDESTNVSKVSVSLTAFFQLIFE